MTFTYDSTDLSTTLAQVRLELGDTDSSAPHFTDEELQVYIDRHPSDNLLAAADAADALALRYSTLYDFDSDNQSFKRSQMAPALRELAKALRERSSSKTAALHVTRVDGFSDDIANDETDGSQQAPRRRYYGQEDRLP